MFADDLYGPQPNPSTGLVGPTSYNGTSAASAMAAPPSTGPSVVTTAHPMTEHLSDGEPGAGHKATTARSILANPTTWLIVTLGTGLFLAWYARGDFGEFVEDLT